MTVLFLRTPFYDDTQVIMVAHEVSKHGVSHRPVAIFQIQNRRIVYEDCRVDLAIREETQFPLSYFCRHLMSAN